MARRARYEPRGRGQSGDWNDRAHRRNRGRRAPGRRSRAARCAARPERRRRGRASGISVRRRGQAPTQRERARVSRPARCRSRRCRRDGRRHGRAAAGCAAARRGHCDCEPLRPARRRAAVHEPLHAAADREPVLPRRRCAPRRAPAAGRRDERYFRARTCARRRHRRDDGDARRHADQRAVPPARLPSRVQRDRSANRLRGADLLRRIPGRVRRRIERPDRHGPRRANGAPAHGARLEPAVHLDLIERHIRRRPRAVARVRAPWQPRQADRRRARRAVVSRRVRARRDGARRETQARVERDRVRR